jgi:prepilin-type N-terminal cleavage/methylation domain-containing protein
MNDDIMKRGSGGFTLVEVMLVIMMVAILAGGTMLALSRGSDNAEATVIMADLDAAKNALLAYSMEHRTRTSDRLDDFMSASSSAITGSLDTYMSSQVSMTGGKTKARFDTIDVDTASGKIRIGFAGFPADRGLIRALERKIASAQSNVVYHVTSNDVNSTCTVWLDVK